jgi:hypothetical protein
MNHPASETHKHLEDWKNVVELLNYHGIGLGLS